MFLRHTRNIKTLHPFSYLKMRSKIKYKYVVIATTLLKSTFILNQRLLSGLGHGIKCHQHRMSCMSPSHLSTSYPALENLSCNV